MNYLFSQRNFVYTQNASILKKPSFLHIYNFTRNFLVAIPYRHKKTIAFVQNSTIYGWFFLTTIYIYKFSYISQPYLHCIHVRILRVCMDDGNTHSWFDPDYLRAVRSKIVVRLYVIK